MTTTYQVIGTPSRRWDGEDKVTGAAVYAADVKLPGTLFGKSLHSPYAHARIVSIDTSAALKVPGVVAVLTSADLPVISGLSSLLGVTTSNTPVTTWNSGDILIGGAGADSLAAAFGPGAKVFLYTGETDAAGHSFRARMFAPGISVPEDPATGSACAALGGYLAVRDPRPDGTLRWIRRFAAPGATPTEQEFGVLAQTLSGIGFYVEGLVNGDADFDAAMRPIEAPLIEGFEADVEAARSEVYSAINSATALRHMLEHASAARDRVLETLSKLQIETDDLRIEGDRAAAEQMVREAADGLQVIAVPSDADDERADEDGDDDALDEVEEELGDDLEVPGKFRIRSFAGRGRLGKCPADENADRHGDEDPLREADTAQGVQHGRRSFAEARDGAGECRVDKGVGDAARVGQRNRNVLGESRSDRVVSVRRSQQEGDVRPGIARGEYPERSADAAPVFNERGRTESCQAGG